MLPVWMAGLERKEYEMAKEKQQVDLDGNLKIINNFKRKKGEEKNYEKYD